MGILNNLFKWSVFSSKSGEEIKIGYVLHGAPKTLDDIEKVLKAFNLDKYLKVVTPLIRPYINLNLTPVEETNFNSGQSKVGGLPDLLKDQEWPKNVTGKPLSFIAQLNFKEISDFDITGLLPKEGLLSFFFCEEDDVWEFEPIEKRPYKLIYTNNTNNLIKTELPKELGQHSIFRPNKITFESGLCLPTWEDESMEEILQDEDRNNYYEASRGSENQIFGYANLIQGPMEMECQLAIHGIYGSEQTVTNELQKKELEAGKEDWVLLLQIGSEDDKTGMMWGDVGRIYFWIHKKDLANKNFDNVWCILQCH